MGTDPLPLDSEVARVLAGLSTATVTPASWGAPISTRAAIEAMPAGCIAVVGALGVAHAGIFGDILCAPMKQRGVAALVSDGVVRGAALPGLYPPNDENAARYRSWVTANGI